MQEKKKKLLFFPYHTVYIHTYILCLDPTQQITYQVIKKSIICKGFLVVCLCVEGGGGQGSQEIKGLINGFKGISRGNLRKKGPICYIYYVYKL